MAEKRLVDANELEEKAIYITGPKGSACHAVPLGLIQAAPTIDPETLRALVMVSNCLEREFVHRQLATGQPLHMNVL